MQAFLIQIPLFPNNDKFDKPDEINPVLKTKYLLEKKYIGRIAKIIINPTPLTRKSRNC